MQNLRNRIQRRVKSNNRVEDRTINWIINYTHWYNISIASQLCFENLSFKLFLTSFAQSLINVILTLKTDCIQIEMQSCNFTNINAHISLNSIEYICIILYHKSWNNIVKDKACEMVK